MNFRDARGDISNNFQLWKVNRINRGAEKVDVNDFDAIGFHEEGRFLDDIVSYIDDQVCCFDGTMHKVAGREGCIAQEFLITFVNDAFAHLGCDVVNAKLVDEIPQRATGDFSIGAGSNDQQWLPGFLQQLDRRFDRFGFGDRSTNEARRNGRLFGLFVGNIFG